MVFADAFQNLPCPDAGNSALRAADDIFYNFINLLQYYDEGRPFKNYAPYFKNVPLQTDSSLSFSYHNE